MTDSQPFEIKVSGSELAVWSSCAQKAAWKFRQGGGRGKDEAMPVAMEVGNYVGAAITGHVFEPAKTIDFDKTTPNMRSMLTQVASMKDAVRKYMEENKMVIEAAEVPYRRKIRLKGMEDVIFNLSGVIDMLVRMPDGSLVLDDLKTGATMPYPFLQLSIYYFLMENEATELPTHLGWIYCPRSITPRVEHRIVPVTPETINVAVRQLRAIYAYETISNYPWNPSPLSCAFCGRPNCPVRAIK